MITEFKHVETGERLLFDDETLTSKGEENELTSQYKTKHEFDSFILFYIRNPDYEYVGDYDPEISETPIEIVSVR